MRTQKLFALLATAALTVVLAGCGSSSSAPDTEEPIGGDVIAPGKKDASAEFNPGVTALAPGTTEVTMTNEQGGIQPLQFTVTVTEKE
mgnify:CR=1 FL=1